jgi:hypothetical protein
MNSSQIKEILRRERSSDSLVFVNEKCPEFYFQGGRLRFPLFTWPTARGFTFAVWFKNSFQLLLKGDEDTYQLSVSQAILSFNGSSFKIDDGRLNDWQFLSLVHTPQNVKICVNGVMIPGIASPYPKTRQWDDCWLGSMVGVGDFVIFKDALKDNELIDIGSNAGYERDAGEKYIKEEKKDAEQNKDAEQKKEEWYRQKSKILALTLALKHSTILHLSASQVDDSESVCYDLSSNLHHAALENVKVIRKIDLLKVYENLNFPISLLTLLPKTTDAHDDVNARVRTFFSVLTNFLMTDKDKYFQKFIDSKGHELLAEIIRNENLAESGLVLLNPILNLRRVTFLFV